MYKVNWAVSAAAASHWESLNESVATACIQYVSKDQTRISSEKFSETYSI